MQKSKKMGVIQLTTLTAINMMGSGIILLPANLASIGTISIFGWILAALGATLLAYAFSICAACSAARAAVWADMRNIASVSVGIS